MDFHGFFFMDFCHGNFMGLEKWAFSGMMQISSNSHPGNTLFSIFLGIYYTPSYGHLKEEYDDQPAG
jgi:hypothetical protein